MKAGIKSDHPLTASLVAFGDKLRSIGSYDEGILSELINLGAEYLHEGCPIAELLDALAKCHNLNSIQYLAKDRKSIILQVGNLSLATTVIENELSIVQEILKEQNELFWMAIELNNNLHAVFAKHGHVSGDGEKRNYLQDKALKRSHLAIANQEAATMISGYITYLIIHFLKLDPSSLANGEWTEQLNSEVGESVYSAWNEIGELVLTLDSQKT